MFEDKQIGSNADLQYFRPKAGFDKLPLRGNRPLICRLVLTVTSKHVSFGQTNWFYLV